MTATALLPIGGDVLDECPRCTWWVRVDELDEQGVCWWCTSSSRCSQPSGREPWSTTSDPTPGRAPMTGG